MISQISPNDVLQSARHTLGLPPRSEPTLDDEILAALLRRSAGINCPCSRATLRTSVFECLQGLTEGGTLGDRIENVIDGLIVGGDLLELSDVVVEDSRVKATWLFAAPPSFVLRPNQTAFLFGVVPDQDSFLPDALAHRVIHQGCTRTIEASTDEDLAAELRDQGLQQLSEGAWLKSPRPGTAQEMVSHFQRLLEREPPAGGIGNADIINPDSPVTYYRGRWGSPQGRTGLHVGRRPQEFGAPLWCAMSLENGVVTRLLDLPLRKSRWRGCDAAWHLQMAIDACRDRPQLYRRRATPEGVRLDFFSPIPEWAERRLMIFGRRATRGNCLFSYILPAEQTQREEQFLNERTWLRLTEDSE